MRAGFYGEHTCTACFRSVSAHAEYDHYDAEDHWPPLCCPGCDCGSYEEAYHAGAHEGSIAPHGTSALD